MRKMTPDEIESWYGGAGWPCGHGREYLPGPRGGMSMNIECPTCHMKINVIDPQSQAQLPVGEVLFEPEGYVPPASRPKRSWWARLWQGARA
jgi:hypothetical protein